MTVTERRYRCPTCGVLRFLFRRETDWPAAVRCPFCRGVMVEDEDREVRAERPGTQAG